MSARIVIPVMALPQLLAGAHVEKCDREENQGENQHEDVLHVEPALLYPRVVSGTKLSS
jgi:hypothetical protein